MLWAKELGPLKIILMDNEMGISLTHQPRLFLYKEPLKMLLKPLN
jgi:hypothetical protein